MTDSTADRLASIRARADAATAGPWEAQDLGGFQWSITPPHMTDEFDNIGGIDQGTDAEFIAAARTDVPFLLDQLAAAEQERDLARASFDDEHEECERAIGRALAAEAKIAQAPHAGDCDNLVSPYIRGFVRVRECTCWKSASPMSALDAVRAEAWESTGARDVAPRAYECAHGPGCMCGQGGMVIVRPRQAGKTSEAMEAALLAAKADAWDEGDRARLESQIKWHEPSSTERMYWPDTVNPYRAARTGATDAQQ